jgi:hypothetical protein
MMKKEENTRNDDVAGKVLKGAAGLAVTAGVVAAGVALMDKKTRKKLAQKAQKGIETLRELTSDFEEEVPKRMSAVAQEIKPLRRKAKRKAKK